MYKVIIERRVYKDLDNISSQDLEKIYTAILGLEIDPRGHGSKKLKDRSDRFRVRQGNYRIVYTINDVSKTVNVVLVRHRKDVYRNL